MLLSVRILTNRPVLAGVAAVTHWLVPPVRIPLTSLILACEGTRVSPTELLLPEPTLPLNWVSFPQVVVL